MGSNIGLSVSTLDPVAVSAMRTPNDHCQDRNVQAARRTAVSKTSGRHSSLPQCGATVTRTVWPRPGAA
jgi:hypothetical protein